MITKILHCLHIQARVLRQATPAVALIVATVPDFLRRATVMSCATLWMTVAVTLLTSVTPLVPCSDCTQFV